MKNAFSGSPRQTYRDRGTSNVSGPNGGAVCIDAAPTSLERSFSNPMELEYHPQELENAGFPAIFETHYPRIYAINYRMIQNREDAEDITQETFIRAYLNYKKLDPHAPVFAWLCKIATNLCIDTARKNKNIRIISLDTFYAAEPLQQRAEHFMKTINLGENIEMEEMVVLVNKALNTMPPHYSQVMVLRGCDEYPPKEVADIMGISVASVNTLFCRAKKKFKSIYQKLSMPYNQVLTILLPLGYHFPHKFHLVLPRLFR